MVNAFVIGNRIRLAWYSLLMLLLAGCNIEGSVSLDGRPMPGQTVVLEGEGNTLTTQTDARGRYRFRQVAAGTYRVRLATQGMTARRVHKPTNNSNVQRVDFVIDTRTKRTLQTGSVVGNIDSNGSLVWRGIPYAQSPTGTLRWKAARAASTWQGDYWALNFSEPCPQLAHLQIDVPLSSIGSVVGDENCLFLNVWTPDFDVVPQDADRRPVMFWIHGGGNTAGESAMFDGKELARKYGVIVVTTNYRLGVLGYLSHPALRNEVTTDLDGSANFAITDLLLALQWVQNNISAFGGDSSRVMIFGESAGASNVAALLAAPQATGLFHRAAMQSGGFGWATRAQAENPASAGGAQASSRELINQLLVADGSAASTADADAIQATMDDQQIRDYLHGKSPAELLAHFDGSRFGMYPYPTLVRDGVVLPDADPYELFSQGNYHRVPIMTGTNRDESKIFMAFNPEYVPSGLPLFIKDPNYFNLSAYYQSTHWRARAVDEFAYALTRQAPSAPVYAYRFDWDEEPKILWNDTSVMIGASHFFEIPFVFNTPDIFPVRIASPLLFTPAKAEGRQILADSMSSYWAAFAYQGDPARGVNDSEAIRWSPWSNTSGENNIILFDSVNDSGIRMVDEKISFASLQSELQQEVRFKDIRQKCKVYAQIFGRDDWYTQQCN